jgi:hypothetical protein
MKRLVASAIVAVCGLGMSAGTVLAQERVMVMATQEAGAQMMGSSRISKSSVDAYGKLLNLTADQKAAAHALHEGYDAEYTKASKDFTSAMEDMRRTAEESDDRSVFMERMPKAREELSKKTKGLEKSFMSDLQALLTGDQGTSWPKVERLRRREVLLRPGSVSGEGVNLLDTVEGLKLSDDVKAQLAESLLAYETDMDRALLAKQKMLDDQPAFDPGRGFDPQAFQEQMKKNREAGLKLQEVNQQYQRRLESSLPEDKRKAFNDAVRKATFPTVYRQSRVARAIDAAAKFEDLTSEQKESLASLKSSYERDAAPANDKWANEIEAAEQKGDNGGEMAIAGGGRMAVRFGEEDNNSPLAQARKNRREIDEKTKSRLDSILTKEQKERLPKDPEGRGSVSAGGAFIVEEARSR